MTKRRTQMQTKKYNKMGTFLRVCVCECVRWLYNELQLVRIWLSNWISWWFQSIRMKCWTQTKSNSTSFCEREREREQERCIAATHVIFIIYSGIEKISIGLLYRVNCIRWPFAGHLLMFMMWCRHRYSISNVEQMKCIGISQRKVCLKFVFQVHFWDQKFWGFSSSISTNKAKPANRSPCLKTSEFVCDLINQSFLLLSFQFAEKFVLRIQDSLSVFGST